MRQVFYLSSHDYVDSPEPRRCDYIADCVVRETGQQLYVVQISPPLPASRLGRPYEVAVVLLGPVEKTSSISDIGMRPFFVDIYYLGAGGVPRHEYSTAELERVGCGLLHSSLSEAIKASPLTE